MAHRIFESITNEELKGRKLPEFRVGDNVKVHVKIKEGDKERVQVFAGTVIARDGAGHTETFTVRRVSYGEGVERIFPICSRSIEKLEIDRPGRPRRAKLYYLRGRSGKKTKIRERAASSAAAPAESANASA
jgi:large subunit ribosomal protein L19